MIYLFFFALIHKKSVTLQAETNMQVNTAPILIWDNYKKDTKVIASRRSLSRLAYILISVLLQANRVLKWRWEAIR